MTRKRCQPVVATSPIAGATLRKINWRLLPFLFVLYVVAWLDRVNVGFAALQMNAQLHFSASAFGFGSGVFFAGYCLFEVPSNLVLHRIGARLWIARIMVTWGALSAATMFVRSPASFYVLRFLLGAAEAGFFPGIVYYLSLWYPAVHQARAIAAFMTAIPVTGLIGGPLSGALLALNGVYGLAGWQWLFLVEGLPALLLGAIVLLYLPDQPEAAHWLRLEERTWLTDKLRAERIGRSSLVRIRVLEALKHPVIWRLGIVFLLTAIGFYGYSFWAPLLIKSLLRTGDLAVGMILGVISAITISCMLLNSWHSDRTRERTLHIAIPLFMTGIGFVGCALLRQPLLAIISLALVPIGHCGSYGPFWSTPSSFLTGAAAAAAIALVATIASIGGFLGPTVIGFLKDKTGTHVAAFLLLAGLAVIAAALALGLRSQRESNNKSATGAISSAD